MTSTLLLIFFQLQILLLLDLVLVDHHVFCTGQAPNIGNITYANVTYVNDAATTPKSPSAVFVFGDSTVDTGNNNHLLTAARANFLPYGLNYPGHLPTGRFSDGKLIPDLLASALGIKDSIPPFLDPTLSDHDLLTGICFASAGAGFDNSTKKGGGVIPLSFQLQMFRNYKTKLQAITGEERAMQVIGNALVIISAGTNDVTTAGRIESNDTTYQDVLLDMVHNFVKELYDMGCRSMLIAGLPPIGCLPVLISRVNLLDRKCLANYNSYAQSYNKKLAKLLSEMEATLSGARVVYLGTYEPFMDMIVNPQRYGFVETNRGCCGTGLFEVAITCNPITPTCRNASQFVFWDSAHPSLSTNLLLADFVVKQLLPKFL